jgi:hypothetical protein
VGFLEIVVLLVVVVEVTVFVALGVDVVVSVGTALTVIGAVVLTVSLLAVMGEVMLSRLMLVDRIPFMRGGSTYWLTLESELRFGPSEMGR